MQEADASDAGRRRKDGQALHAFAFCRKGDGFRGGHLEGGVRLFPLDSGPGTGRRLRGFGHGGGGKEQEAGRQGTYLHGKSFGFARNRKPCRQGRPLPACSSVMPACQRWRSHTVGCFNPDPEMTILLPLTWQFQTSVWPAALPVSMCCVSLPLA